MRRRGVLAAAGAMLASPRLGRGAERRVLRFVPQADLAVLDPVWTTAYQSRDHAFLVFDTLFGQDAEFAPRLQMLEAATTEAAGLVWRLLLRPGLVFHDGTPVLARDCVASIRRWGTRDGFGQALLAATDDLSTGDDRTVVFRLKRPFPLLPDALGKTAPSACVIMPERLAQADAFTQVGEMVGSGPYRYLADERVPGARVAYARFDGYVPRADGVPSRTAGPKRASFDRVEWHIIPDAATASAALQRGEVDWWLAANTDLLPPLRADRRLVVKTQDPSGIIATMRFNQLHPPFDNPAIRRAVLGAVTQSDHMEAVSGPDRALWTDGVGYFCPGTPLASDAGMESLTRPRDLARSRRELEAAGYRGERVMLMMPTDIPSVAALAEVTADLFRRTRAEPRCADDGLGHGGAAPDQSRAAGQGRLERVPDQLVGPRPRDPCQQRVLARQRPGGGAGVGSQSGDRAAARRLAGSRSRGAEAAGRAHPTPGVSGCPVRAAGPAIPADRLSCRPAGHPARGTGVLEYRARVKWGASVARCPPNRACHCLRSDRERLMIVIGTCDMTR